MTDTRVTAEDRRIAKANGISRNAIYVRISSGMPRNDSSTGAYYPAALPRGPKALRERFPFEWEGKTFWNQRDIIAHMGCIASRISKRLAQENLTMDDAPHTGVFRPAPTGAKTLTWNGQTLTLAGWAKKLGISLSAMADRVRTKWEYGDEPGQMFGPQVKGTRGTCVVHFEERDWSLVQIALDVGICEAAARQRFRDGRPPSRGLGGLFGPKHIHAPRRVVWKGKVWDDRMLAGFHGATKADCRYWARVLALPVGDGHGELFDPKLKDYTPSWPTIQQRIQELPPEWRPQKENVVSGNRPSGVHRKEPPKYDFFSPPLTAAEAADKVGVTYALIRSRIRRGAPLDDSNRGAFYPARWPEGSKEVQALFPFTWKGVTYYNAADIRRETGMNRATLGDRLRKEGVTTDAHPETGIFRDVIGKNLTITWGKDTLSIAEWARKTGLTADTIRARFLAAWPIGDGDWEVFGPLQRDKRKKRVLKRGTIGVTGWGGL